MKKCICIKNFDSRNSMVGVFDRHGLYYYKPYILSDFTIGAAAHINILYSNRNKSEGDGYLVLKNNKVTMGVFFNQESFNKYFMDLQEMRRIKLQKITHENNP